MCRYKEYLYCLCHHHVRCITPCRQMRWLRAAMELRRSIYKMAGVVPARIIAGVRRPWPQFLHSRSPKISDLEQGLAVQGPTVEEASQASEAQRVQKVQRGLEVPEAIKSMRFATQAAPAGDLKQTQATQGAQHVPQEVPEVQEENEAPDPIRSIGFARPARPARFISARQAEGSEFARTQVADVTEAQEAIRHLNSVIAPPVPSTGNLESYTSQVGGEGDTAGIAHRHQNVTCRISQLVVPSTSDLERCTYGHGETENGGNDGHLAAHPEGTGGHGEAETRGTDLHLAPAPEITQLPADQRPMQIFIKLSLMRRKPGRIMSSADLKKLSKCSEVLIFKRRLSDHLKPPIIPSEIPYIEAEQFIEALRAMGYSSNALWSKSLFPADPVREAHEAELERARRMAGTEAARRKKEEEYEPEVLEPQRLEDGAPISRVMKRTMLDLKNHPPPPKPEYFYNADKTACDATAGDDIDDTLPPGPFCPPPKQFRTENHADLCPDCVKIYEKAKIPHHWANHYVVEYKRNVVYYDVTKLQHLPDGSRWGCVEISGYTPSEIMKMDKVFTGDWNAEWKPIVKVDSNVYWRIVPKKKKVDEKKEKKEKTLKERESAMKLKNRTPWRVDLEKGGFTLNLKPPYQDMEPQAVSEIDAAKEKEESAKKKEKAAIKNIHKIGLEDMETIHKEGKELNHKLREARWIEANKVRKGFQGEAVSEAQWKLAFKRSELEKLGARQLKKSEAQTQRGAAVLTPYEPRGGRSSDFNVQGRFDDSRQRFGGLAQPGPRAMPKSSNTLDDAQGDYPQLTPPQRAYIMAVPQYNPLVAGPRGPSAPNRTRINTITPHYEAPHRARKNTVTVRPSNLKVVERAETPDVNSVRPAPVGYGVGNGTSRSFTPYRDEHGYYSVDGSYIPYTHPHLVLPQVSSTLGPSCPAEAFYRAPEAGDGDIGLTSLNSISNTQFNTPRPLINRTPTMPASAALHATKAAYEERRQEKLNLGSPTKFDEPRPQVNLPPTTAPAHAAQAVLQTPKLACLSSASNEPRTPNVLPHGPARANTTIDYPRSALRPRTLQKKPSKQKLKANKHHKKQDAYGDDYDDQGVSDESKLFIIGDDSDDEGSDENRGRWEDGDEGLQLRKSMGMKKPEADAVGGRNKKERGYGLWKKVVVEKEEERNARMSYIAPPPLKLQTMPESPMHAFTDSSVQKSENKIAPEPRRTEPYALTHGLMTASGDLEAARRAIQSRLSGANSSMGDSYEEAFARRAAMLAPPPDISAPPENVRSSTSTEPVRDEVMVDPTYFEKMDAYGAASINAAPPRRPHPAALILFAPVRQNPEWSNSSGLGSERQTPGERRRRLWDEKDEGSGRTCSLQEGETENGGKWAAC